MPIRHTDRTAPVRKQASAASTDAPSAGNTHANRPPGPLANQRPDRTAPVRKQASAASTDALSAGNTHANRRGPCLPPKARLSGNSRSSPPQLVSSFARRAHEHSQGFQSLVASRCYRLGVRRTHDSVSGHETSALPGGACQSRFSPGTEVPGYDRPPSGRRSKSSANIARANSRTAFGKPPVAHPTTKKACR